MENIVSKILRDYRKEKKVSQAALADRLGVSQVTVSRIEAGQQIPSADLASEIRSLVQEFPAAPLPVSPSTPRTEKRAYSKNGFTFAYTVMADSALSGDVCSIDKLGGGRFSFILADAVGHGGEAGYMSFGIRFGYKIMLALLQGDLIDPELLEKGLSSAIGETRTLWVGPPSLTVGVVDTNTGMIELINSGNPALYRYSGNSIQTVDHSPIRSSIPLFERKNRSDGGKLVNVLDTGSSLLIYTDGFQELFRGTRSDLKSKFHRAAKLFKGEAETILNNLLPSADISMLSDDASALVISRKRDRQ